MLDISYSLVSIFQRSLKGWRVWKLRVFCSKQYLNSLLDIFTSGGSFLFSMHFSQNTTGSPEVVHNVFVESMRVSLVAQSSSFFGD